MGVEELSKEWTVVMYKKMGIPGGSVGRIHLPMQKPQIQSLGREDPLEKEWQPTPVFLPGKSHRQRSLVDYPWSCKRERTQRLNNNNV